MTGTKKLVSDLEAPELEKGGGDKMGGKNGGWEEIMRENTVFIWFRQEDKPGCRIQSQAVFLGSHYHLPAL